jgi:RNA polymerase sigma-70 factor (ECF subfamily)
MEGVRALEPSIACTDPNPVMNLQAIVAEHGAFVWRALRRQGVGAADVEDVAKKASEHRRRAWLRRERPVAAPPEESAPPGQPEAVRRREAQAQLEAILGELDPRKRDVFVLFELEEMSLAEVAAAVGCPLQTAYSRLQSARALVQASIARLHAREGLS